jgi:hypothetical protein
LAFQLFFNLNNLGIMKNMLIFASLLFLFGSCGNGSSSTTNTNIPSIDLTGFTVTDLPGGYQKVVKSNADGKILEEGVLKNGKRNGMWVVYQDRRPLPKSIINFVDDQYSGTYMEYSATGQLELICSYTANKLDGKFIRVKNTRLLEEGTYVNGEIDGNYKKFYPSKDILQQENNYKMGKLHGSTKYYNEEGQVIMEYEYNNGEKVSGGLVEPEEKGANKE